MRYLKNTMLFILFCIVISPNAFAWGKNGHRIIAEIAQQNLDAKTFKSIAELAGIDGLSRISTWADEIRSDPKMNFANSWHYVSIPNGKTYFDQKRSKDGDLIEALYRFEDLLRDKKETKEHKLDALRFLIHMLGDLHQPLHVGLAEDRGGNSVHLKWFKTVTNLHSVWDDELIDFEKLSFSEYAKFLNHFTKEEKKDFEKGFYLDWAKESQDLRSTVYDFGNSSENISLSYDYVFKAKPIVELRLRAAGIRMAFVLKKIFLNSKISNVELDIKKKIVQNI